MSASSHALTLKQPRRSDDSEIYGELMEIPSTTKLTVHSETTALQKTKTFRANNSRLPRRSEIDGISTKYIGTASGKLEEFKMLCAAYDQTISRRPTSKRSMIAL